MQMVQFVASETVMADSDRLYLSNAEALQIRPENTVITHVLSLTAEPIDFSWKSELIGYQWLETYDEENERLLDKFETIIEEFNCSKCMLIHCQQGVSRSVSAVVAILMKIEGLGVESVMKLLSEKGIDTSKIIDGFRVQLGLFEKFGCTVDKFHPDYRFWRFSVLSCDAGVNDILWSSISDQTESKTVYRCSKCRHKLFKNTHIVQTSHSIAAINTLSWNFSKNWHF